MTTTEAAATIGIHRNTMWNAINQGHIPATKIGNAIALDPKDVAAFRARYLRGEVTTTSVEPKKKGRPLKLREYGESCPCEVCGGEERKLTCALAAQENAAGQTSDPCPCAVCEGGERKPACTEHATT